MKTLFAYFTKTKIVLAVVVIAVAGGGYTYFSSEPESPYETVVVQRGSLIQQVNTTGTVKPAENVSLSFERSGTVSAVYADVGDSVSAGQMIARLSAGDISAQYQEAQASLESAQARLQSLREGTRAEEITIQQTQVQQNQTAVEEKKEGLDNAIQDAFLKSHDAVYAKADTLFSSARSSNPDLDIPAATAGEESEMEWHRQLAGDALVGLEQAANTGLQEGSEKEQADEIIEHLKTIRTFLQLLSEGVNKLSFISSLSETTIDGYKTDVGTARTNVQAAVSSVTTARDALQTAKSNLELAQQELDLLQAGATVEDISEQEAQVRLAEAGVARQEAELAKTVIRAPFAGVVTIQEAEVGENITANTNAVEIITQGEFMIETFVPEVDIALIEVGDTATFTLDAYGPDRTFEANVVRIDPAETVIEGVSTYKVTLAFEDNEGAARSGMTANIDILTASRENIIAIPSRAVENENGTRTVRILGEDGSVGEREVQVGIRGSDGRIEITGGLSEGEEVIVFERQ